MKKYMIGAGAVLALVLWARAKKLRAAESAITEPAMSQSSDWQGDMWDRLKGLDLGGFNALTGGSAQAAPSHLDVMALRS